MITKGRSASPRHYANRDQMRLTDEQAALLLRLRAHFGERVVMIATGSSNTGLTKLDHGGLAGREMVERVVAGLERLEKGGR